MTLGKEVVNARTKLGLNQKEFAEILGKNATYLCSIETDARVPGLKLIRKISEKTGTPLQTFIKYYI